MITWKAACKSFLAGLLGACLSASAQAADTFFLENGNVGVSGQQMTITRLPIRRSNGSIVYKDVTIQFTVDSALNLRITSGFPKTVASPTILVGNFRPGLYDISGSSQQVRITGPGAGPSGRGTYTLTNGHTEMTFYTGPVAGHPYQARLNAAGITSSSSSFGIVSKNTSSSSINDDYFFYNSLASLTNVNGDVLVQSHTNPAGQDSKLPVFSQTLKPAL